MHVRVDQVSFQMQENIIVQVSSKETALLAYFFISEYVNLLFSPRNSSCTVYLKHVEYNFLGLKCSHPTQLDQMLVSIIEYAQKSNTLKTDRISQFISSKSRTVFHFLSCNPHPWFGSSCKDCGQSRQSKHNKYYLAFSFLFFIRSR